MCTVCKLNGLLQPIFNLKIKFVSFIMSTTTLKLLANKKIFMCTDGHFGNLLYEVAIVASNTYRRVCN